MFGVLPNFKTVNDPNQPVTSIGPSEKFQLVLHYFDPFTFAITSIQAGIEQDTNAKASYGQGTLGYAKRFGADFTDAFHQRAVCGGGVSIAAARRSTILPIGPRQRVASHRLRAEPNSDRAHGFRRASLQLLGVSGQLHVRLDFAAYYPQNERGIGGVLTRMTVQIGYDALFNVLKEFYPDLKRKLHRKNG